MIIGLQDRRMKPAKVVDIGPAFCIWTPSGLRDLGEPSDLGYLKPCLLGTFDSNRAEFTFADQVEDGPPGLVKDSFGRVDIDKRRPVMLDSSHDLTPMLG